MNKEDLIFTLDLINQKIINSKNLELEDLKKLILICYNELVDSNDSLIKSILITTLYHFIQLENEFQETENFSYSDTEILIRFVNKKNFNLINKGE